MKERLISIEDVTFYYAGSRTPALKDVSLSVYRGDFLLVTGPSGCGKSTLCRLLNGLIPHFFSGELRGKVQVLDYDVKSTPTHVLARHVGMVFQNPENQLFLSSVEKEIVFGLENLGLPKKEIKRRLEEVIDLLELNDIRDKPPYELSGGQQQKVAIAAVVAMGPEIMVLDEPTAHLDPLSSKEVLSLVFKLNKELGVTVILVEHRLDMTINRVSKILVMNKGEIILIGEPRDVLNNKHLEELGVNTPKVVKVYNELKEKGIVLSQVPLTPEELASQVKLRRARLIRDVSNRS